MFRKFFFMKNLKSSILGLALIYVAFVMGLMIFLFLSGFIVPDQKNSLLVYLTLNLIISSGVVFLLIRYLKHLSLLFEEEKNKGTTLEKQIKKTTVLMKELAVGNLDVATDEDKDQGEMLVALRSLQQNMFKARNDEKQRQDEDRKRTWVTEGVAKFADLLRQRNMNFADFGFEIIMNLVKYLGVNQGGLYLINDDDTDKYIELVGSYAYGRRKFNQKRIEMGEGLVGASILERQTIFLLQVPPNYLEIQSGLGDAPPRSITITPLTIEDEVYGVIEVASFQPLEKYKIEFLEKVSESIAATMAGIKQNMKTEKLLAESRQNAELMKQQDEEMRQNMEEMQAIQEALIRKEDSLKLVANEINSVEERLKLNIQKIRNNR